MKKMTDYFQQSMEFRSLLNRKIQRKNTLIHRATKSIFSDIVSVLQNASDCIHPLYKNFQNVEKMMNCNNSLSLLPGRPILIGVGGRIATFCIGKSNIAIAMRCDHRSGLLDNIADNKKPSKWEIQDEIEKLEKYCLLVEQQYYKNEGRCPQFCCGLKVIFPKKQIFFALLTEDFTKRGRIQINDVYVETDQGRKSESYGGNIDKEFVFYDFHPDWWKKEINELKYCSEENLIVFRL